MTSEEKQMKEQMDVIKGLSERPKNVVEDNYVRYYAVNKETHEDVYVDKHFNGMYIIGLAPSHPIRMNKLNITQISFDLGKRTASSFDVTGKKKKNAIKLQANTKLCNLFVEMDSISENESNMEQNESKENNNKNGKSEIKCFTFKPLISAKVIEINKRLINNPKLIHDSGDIEGYIAICESMNYQWNGRKNNNVKKRKTKNVEDDLLNKQQYQQYLTECNLKVSFF
eukprot:458125_1